MVKTMMSSRVHLVKVNVGRVKSVMAARKMSQEETAKQLGISRSAFSRIFTDGKCSAFMLGRIARVLEVPVWELVDR